MSLLQLKDRLKMLQQIEEAGASKLVESVERIYREAKEEWNYQSKEKINKYLMNMMQRYGEVKTILHGNNPKPFYDVYYPLSLSINRRLISSPTARALFRRRQALIVTADAGSGKSMLVKHLFNSAIKESYKIPFVIELRYLNTAGDSLEEYIERQIHAHITESTRIKKRLLEEGSLIFFLDGYDEVKKELKQEVVKSLKEMHERFTKCKFLISTRPYTDLEMLSNLSTIQIMPLSTDDVQRFIRQQIQDIELSERIIMSVSEADQSKFSSFLKNPLLLTLYILTYKNSSEIPSKASVFYRRVIDSLFIEHDSKTKVGFQRERISGVSFDKFYDVMRKFSFVSFFEDRFSFDNHYACSLFQRIISKDANCTFSPEDLIDDLKLSFSFWIDDSGILSFAHKSLQEYFCALYIHDLDSPHKDDIYGRLLRKAGDYSDQFNILSILEEIDTSNYLERYFIPVLADLKNLVEAQTSVSQFFGSIFPDIWITPEKKSIHVRIAPGLFRPIQILDKTQPGFRELYQSLQEEIVNAPIVMQWVESSIKRKRSAKSEIGLNVSLKSPPKEIASMLDANSKLVIMKSLFEREIDTLISGAHEAVRVEKEINEDLLSMI